jgi:predicted DNA-binding WGR domain protein
MIWNGPDAPLGAALRRCDPARRMARFYAVTVQPTLFGEWAVVRRWGRINTEGRWAEAWYCSVDLACADAMRTIVAKRRRGYIDAEQRFS